MIMIEMVYMTHVCVSVCTSMHPMLQTLLSSGGMHNHLTPSPQTPFHLFRLSQPLDPLRHLPDPLIPPRRRCVKRLSAKVYPTTTAFAWWMQTSVTYLSCSSSPWWRWRRNMLEARCKVGGLVVLMQASLNLFLSCLCGSFAWYSTHFDSLLFPV